MNVKIFGIFIILIGVVALGYGFMVFQDNPPVTEADSIGEALDTVGNTLSGEMGRDEGRNIMIGGGIVLILGLGLAASAKAA